LASHVILPRKFNAWSLAQRVRDSKQTSERHSGICFAPLPASPMHHREALSKDMHASEPAVFEDVTAPLAFEEAQAQQHDDERAQLQRGLDEFLGQLEWWVCDNGLNAGRNADFAEKVASKMKVAVIDQIGSNHRMPMVAQHARDAARTGVWLPVRNRFDAQQCLDRAGRRLIKIQAALGERVTLDLVAVVEHWNNSRRPA
jgi:hypothetical protein